MIGTWREKLTRPVVLVVCGLVCVTESSLAVSVSRAVESPAPILTLLIAAGSVGRDLSSGVLALLFTRPLQRSAYVFAKWVAVSGAAMILSCVTLAVQAVLLAQQGNAVSGAEIWAAMFASATTSFGLSSVLVLFSVLIPGVGDVAAWGALMLLGFLSRRVVSPRFGEEWKAVLQPELAWNAGGGTGLSSWLPVISYLSTVTLCLYLAVVAVNRKEISYASG